MNGPVAGTGADLAVRAAALDEILSLLAPAVEADGGALRLVDADLERGVVTVALSGACGACVMSSMTLEAGVARILRERLPWVTEVHGLVEADPRP